MRTFALAVLLLAAACSSSWHEQSAPVPQVLERKHPSVLRVTRTDQHQVVLTDPKLVADTLVGQRDGKATAIALSDITTVAVRQGSGAGAVGVFALLAVVAVVAIGISSGTGN